MPVLAIYPQASHMLDTLDYCIDNHNTYRDIRCASLRAKCKKINATPHGCQRLPLYEDIIKQYLHVEADSAIVYSDRALQLCRACEDSTEIAKFKALRCGAQTMSGEVHLAAMMFEAIEPQTVAQADKEIFFELGYLVYSRAYIYLRHERETMNLDAKLTATLDSINRHCKDAALLRFFSDIKQIHTGNAVDGVADLIDLINSTTPGSYLYGQMTLEVARYYKQAAQYDLAKYYFTLAGINNLRGGYNETEALHGLGNLLHDEGDMTRANRYLKTTLDRALLVGDNAAAMRISQSLKTLLDDVSQDATTNRRSYVLSMILLAFLAVIVICWIIFYFYKRNTYHKNNRELSQKHYSKNYYIRQILALCANQITAFEDYNRLVSRKIKGSQVQDLLRISESGKAIAEQMETFHATFDSAFLSMHPDFIENVNKLLLPDKQLTAPNAGGLNTELRFLAFMCLGLDDCQQLATFLGITQNSVYTYKNKLKSKAIDRSNFEENIKKLA